MRKTRSHVFAFRDPRAPTRTMQTDARPETDYKRTSTTTRLFMRSRATKRSTYGEQCTRKDIGKVVPARVF